VIQIIEVPRHDKARSKHCSNDVNLEWKQHQTPAAFSGVGQYVFHGDFLRLNIGNLTLLEASCQRSSAPTLAEINTPAAATRADASKIHCAGSFAPPSTCRDGGPRVPVPVPATASSQCSAANQPRPSNPCAATHARPHRCFASRHHRPKNRTRRCRDKCVSVSPCRDTNPTRSRENSFVRSGTNPTGWPPCQKPPGAPMPAPDCKCRPWTNRGRRCSPDRPACDTRGRSSASVPQ